METVAVPLGDKSYNICIKEGILGELPRYIGESADKWLILTDENVDRLYGKAITQAMGSLPFVKFAVPAGESVKTLTTVETVIEFMLDAQLTRSSAIIGFGGGVIGDLAGFCASIYMRGINFVQVPTTLLAQVDSSVGGKTGVNVRSGKNMAGTFYQPHVVLIDTGLLATLSAREFTAGLGEVIKYGLIYDYEFLKFIEDNLDQISALDFNVINPLIGRCCQIKAEVVGQDETERDLRKILNFGHTFGHALETVTQYERYLHGEAVLIGMYYESLLARKLNLIEDEYWREIADLIVKTGISADIHDLSINKLTEQMTKDKKNRGGQISFILPTGAGQVAEYLLPFEEVVDLFQNC